MKNKIISLFLFYSLIHCLFTTTCISQEIIPLGDSLNTSDLSFLKDKIKFSEISGYIDSVLSLFVAPNPSSIEEIIEVDEAVRAYTLELMRKSKSSDFSRL